MEISDDEVLTVDGGRPRTFTAGSLLTNNNNNNTNNNKPMDMPNEITAFITK